MDAFRAEFPGLTGALTRVGAPAVRQSDAIGGLVSGVGAAFVVRGIAQLAVAPLYALVYPPTRPHRAWLTPSAISNPLAEFAAGLVLMRVGGPLSVAGYVLIELLVLVASLPGRAPLCAQLANTNATGVPCDLPAMIAGRWVLWLALALGVAAFRFLPSREEEGTNQLLRAAGAYSLVITVFGNAATLWIYTHGSPSGIGVNLVFATGQLLAGFVAGALLAYSAFARQLLLALLIAVPLSASLPVLREQLASARNAAQPAEYYFGVWSSLLVPPLAAFLVFAGAVVWRVRDEIAGSE